MGLMIYKMRFEGDTVTITAMMQPSPRDRGVRGPCTPGSASHLGFYAGLL